METAAFLLTLASSLFWAGFDLTRKRLTQELPTLHLAFFLIGGQIPFYLVWIFVQDLDQFSSAYWLPGSLCALSNLYGNLVFLKAIQISQISLTIPMLTLTPVFSALISYAMMDESLAPKQMLGIGLIVTGSMIIQGMALLKFLSKGRSHSDKNNYLGILLMTTVAFAWSVTAALDKFSMQVVSAPVHALVQCLFISVTIFLYIKMSRQPEPLKLHSSAFKIYALALLVGVLALSTQLLALKGMYVGLFEATKRSAGIIFSIAFGALFFAEDLRVSKLIGGAIIITGVWLLF